MELNIKDDSSQGIKPSKSIDSPITSKPRQPLQMPYFSLPSLRSGTRTRYPFVQTVRGGKSYDR